MNPVAIDARDKAERGDYLYCIVSPRPAAEVLAGVRSPDGSPLRLLEDGRASAVVRTVAWDRYGEGAAARFAEDLESLGEEVRHHELVAERLAERGHTVLPGRFGLVYRDDEGVLAALRAERENIERAIERRAGREEWGLRLWGDRNVLGPRLAASDEEIGRLDEETRGSM